VTSWFPAAAPINNAATNAGKMSLLSPTNVPYPLGYASAVPTYIIPLRGKWPNPLPWTLSAAIDNPRLGPADERLRVWPELNSAVYGVVDHSR
jgi:hypothetical protein